MFRYIGDYSTCNWINPYTIHAAESTLNVFFRQIVKDYYPFLFPLILLSMEGRHTYKLLSPLTWHTHTDKAGTVLSLSYKHTSTLFISSPTSSYSIISHIQLFLNLQLYSSRNPSTAISWIPFFKSYLSHISHSYWFIFFDHSLIHFSSWSLPPFIL